ncbi:BrnA antitoxin family protein [Massilia sp. CF038]|uniref:BrnA antitoxin family protein n=1 Tax=Massilia sp. CF038 TaxID=1881045 RepID=UPI0009168E4C|nr:BrnA antitoxin family protein [Massilia sp. CF038]SHH29159.1 BrnA antitoxin of type II toxin-antitoxin system [Massilia sp. CF038]
MNEDFQATWPEQASLSSNNGGENAARPVGNPALKQIVTIRLDVDMLNWFKSAGPGYQTRINQILREHMDAQRANGGKAD